MNTKRMLYLFAGVFLIITTLVVLGLVFAKSGNQDADDTPEVVAELDISGYSIVVAELQDARDGWIEINELETQSEGWLAIYNDNDGAMGEVIAYKEIEAGGSGSILFAIQPHQATHKLYAVLHSDGGKLGTFEPDLDAILSVNNEDLIVEFRVTLAGAVSDIFVEDQELQGGTAVEVSEVSSPDFPAWLVIYNDNNGEPGEIIGYTWLEEEAAEYLMVSLDGEVTTTLYAGLHLDLGAESVFEPEGEDRLIYLFEERQLVPFDILEP